MSHILSAIRPEDVHQEYGALLQSDITQLFKNSSEWSARVCPLCLDATHRDRLVVMPNGSYWECQSCGLVYLDRIPSQSSLRHYFQEGKSSSYFHERILLPTATERKLRFFSSRIDLLKEVGATEKSVVLDIGCSIGSFLEVLTDNKMKAYGMEPNLKARTLAEAAGQTVFGNWEELKRHLKPHSVDYLTAWEVFAHLDDLQSEMENIRKILKPGGFLILTTPNVQALEYRLLKGDHPNFNFPFLQLFSIGSIKKFISKFNFNCEQISTPGEHDVETIGQYLLKQGGVFSNYPFLEDLVASKTPEAVLFRKEFQQVLVHSHLSGHIRLIAKKSL